MFREFADYPTHNDQDLGILSSGSQRILALLSGKRGPKGWAGHQKLPPGTARLSAKEAPQVTAPHDKQGDPPILADPSNHTDPLLPAELRFVSGEEDVERRDASTTKVSRAR